MSAIIGLITIAMLFFILLYPAYLIIESFLYTRHWEFRMREWKLLTLRLATIEYQMTETVNQIRQGMGKSRIPYIPVIESYKSMSGWDGIKNKIKDTISGLLGQNQWTQP